MIFVQNKWVDLYMTRVKTQCRQKRQPLSTSPIPSALYHVLISPAETLRLPVRLFFTMATCCPDGNEGVLQSITGTNLTSAVTLSKMRIKHGLLLNSDLMNREMTEDEKTGDQPVVFLTCLP